jgi:hypothetical protein
MVSWYPPKLSFPAVKAAPMNPPPPSSPTSKQSESQSKNQKHHLTIDLIKKGVNKGRGDVNKTNYYKF